MILLHVCMFRHDDMISAGADPGVGKGRGTNRLSGWKNRAS